MHVNASLLLLPMPFEMRPNDNCIVCFLFSKGKKERRETKECGNKMKIDLSKV